MISYTLSRTKLRKLYDRNIPHAVRLEGRVRQFDPDNRQYALTEFVKPDELYRYAKETGIVQQTKILMQREAIDQYERSEFVRAR
ncbi:hypothetical protein ACTHQ4_10415 [Alkalicoccobacillus gibsonii]|uniref:hypothetical protein n=1 Tax=Alkalicoccobacillus gibsonii TaxID=79881 RepID=UPI003F7B3AAC